MLVDELIGASDERVAIRDQAHGVSVTYGELAERVVKRQAALGTTEGCLALLGFSTDVEAIVTYLALVRGKATIALLDPSLSAERLALLTQSYRPEFITGFQSAPDQRCDPPGPMLEERILLSTSGSTGSPKLVRLAESSIHASARQIIAGAGITPDDTALLSLPLHYSFGLSVLNSHLLAGASVVIGSKASMSAEFGPELADCGVTNLYAVPFAVDIFNRTNLFGRPLGQLRSVTVAGGRLAPEVTLALHEALAAHGVELLIRYGATEATSAITILPAAELPARVGSVGLPLEGITLNVLDPDDDGVGGLRVTGPNVMMGYSKTRDDLGCGSRTGGTIETGDSVRLDVNGHLWVMGRLSRFAKLQGHRISLDHIEHELAGTVQCAAIEDSEHIVLVVEVHDSPLPPARDIERRLGLGPGVLKVHGVAALPRTTSGKIDYRQAAQLVNG